MYYHKKVVHRPFIAHLLLDLGGVFSGHSKRRDNSNPRADYFSRPQFQAPAASTSDCFSLWAQESQCPSALNSFGSSDQEWWLVIVTLDCHPSLSATTESKIIDLHQGDEFSCKTHTPAVHAMHFLILLESQGCWVKNKAMVHFRSIYLVAEKAHSRPLPLLG